MERFRAEWEAPDFLKQLETLIRRRPDGSERVESIQARIAKMLESRGR